MAAIVVLMLLTALPALFNAPPLRADTLTLYGGQGMDSNLPNIPGKVLRGNLSLEQSFFAGLGYQHSITTPDVITHAGAVLGATQVDSNVELVAVKHHGLQDNFETDVAYSLQLPRLVMGMVAMRFGLSAGLAYAWDTPTYEDTSDGDSSCRYRLQMFDAFELQWQLRHASSVSLVTRIHHRSGAYGLLAPRRVGSNFLALGLRYTY